MFFSSPFDRYQKKQEKEEKNSFHHFVRFNQKDYMNNMMFVDAIDMYTIYMYGLPVLLLSDLVGVGSFYDSMKMCTSKLAIIQNNHLPFTLSHHPHTFCSSLFVLSDANLLEALKLFRLSFPSFIFRSELPSNLDDNLYNDDHLKTHMKCQVFAMMVMVRCCGKAYTY